MFIWSNKYNKSKKTQQSTAKLLYCVIVECYQCGFPGSVGEQHQVVGAGRHLNYLVCTVFP